MKEFKYGDKVIVKADGKIGKVGTVWNTSRKMEVKFDFLPFYVKMNFDEVRKVTKLDKALK